MNRLQSFPVSEVKAVHGAYNKAFHSRIFTLFSSSESFMNPRAGDTTPRFEVCFCFNKHDEGQWFVANKQLERVRDWVISQANDTTQHVSALYKAWEKEWKHFDACAHSMLTTNLQELSDSQLWEKTNTFYQAYLGSGSIAYITDSFMSTGSKDWLEVLITNELKRLNIPQDIKDTARLLCTPNHQTFTIVCENQLFKLAEKIDKWEEIPQFSQLKEKNPVILQELAKLEAEYYWIENNYFHYEYLDAQAFYERAKKILHESRIVKAPIMETLRKRDVEHNAIENKRSHALRTIPLSNHIRNVIEIAELFTIWKDQRKSGVAIGMYHFGELLNEIARRRNMSLDDVGYLVLDETKDLILSKKDCSELIKKRRQQTFYAVTRQGYFITEGTDAQKYFDYFESDYAGIKEVQGVTASPGIAQGSVRVIRKTHEMKQFGVGEILITNQTTPEFVPIMKKAAAIVTEQGGITSHAAIISRELGKPCIIGTKIATKVFKDGDVVEVDANRGVVRKI